MDESAEVLREKGNEAIKNHKYEEAVLHYTQAIKMDPNNFALYSNRSLAFLKVQQYYFALQDANETIRLNPSWPKGYFRKAEVEYTTKHYLAACESYQKALNLKPDDTIIAEALSRSKQEILKERKADQTTPWLGAMIGIAIGVTIVVADFILTHKPTHPLLMTFVTIIIAMVGYGIARTYRYYVKSQKYSLLEAPVDLFDEQNSEEPEAKEGKSQTPRYTKSQARQRYKSGKM